MLHEIDEVRVYCGPAAIMAVTGKRLPEVRAAINTVRKKPAHSGVCGMYDNQVRRTLNILGVEHYYQSTEFPEHVKTLEKMVKDKRWCLPDHQYIISITGHYVAVENGIVIDNHTRFGCPVEKHWSRRKKVKSVFMVYKEEIKC